VRAILAPHNRDRHRRDARERPIDRIYALDVDGTRFTFFARIPSRTTAADRAELQAIIDSIGIEPLSSPPPSGASPSP
jgi:hypothetical protein